MSLQFTNFCNLLTELESFSSRRPPLLPARCQHLCQRAISQWFRTYKVTIDSTNPDAVVVLSALLPAKRTDRVYHLQASLLTKKLRRCLSLGEGRWQQLEQWKVPERGDLGECVERAQLQAEFAVPLPGYEVTLEEVDRTLENIAKACRFSAPSVRGDSHEGVDVIDSLRRIYHRLQSREAKWFTRMILKDYGNIEINEGFVFRCLDSRLPAMMKIQDNFESAINSLRSLRFSGKTENASPRAVSGPVSNEKNHVPKIGVKVGRNTYLIGRSIKNVVDIVDGRTMSVERKYDGEYCQIHIDLTKDQQWIQIFSKSGKDSTKDRRALHSVVKDSLRIGHDQCGLSRNCILEGEIVVWNDATNKIMDFCKIRKHVDRSGSFLGTDLDSQRHIHEHLMIFFYDVMLIDDDPVLKKPQRIRRQLLEKLVKSIKGRAKLASRREIEFSSSTGPRQLQAALASAITHRWEGLVLKPTDEPYFSVYNQNPRHRFPSCWIKFKKDYIPGLGDTADFAVVGASYTHSEAVKIGNLSLKWTDFYIGCLRNKLDVLQHGAKPQFTVLVALNQCIKAEDVLTLNRLGQFSAVEAGSKDATELFYLDYQSGLPKISVVFRKPFVFEVLGSGFDRMPNQTIHTLRFPRVLKIHWDRDWKESVGLDELQEMAKKARTVPAGDVSADIKNWYMRLEKINRGTKGLMAPWDNSQEERDTEDHTAIGALEASSQGQPYESPVFVRMDTNEMIREENRLQCGDAEDGRTLGKRRPSTSPSRQLLSDLLCTSDFVAEETVKCRKRIAERDVESDLRPSKKMNINQPASAVVQELDRSVDATHVTPLASITNLSRSRKTPPIKPQKNYAHSKFSLLNKLAIGTDERGKTNVQRTIPTSSSARETSVSQCTTDRPSQSTQNTEMESPTRATTLSQVSNSSISITESVPTAPIELCEESDDLVVQIPDLQESGVMLSPCVENIPYVLEDLLRPSKIPTTPFPNANTSSDDCNSMFKNAPSSESIVFLIESKRESASVEAMKRLVTILPKSPFAEIAIWDWRLLEAVQKDSLSDEDWEKVACKRFIGTLAWADESGEKVMQMDWGYGKVARIPAVLWNPGP